MEYNIRKVSQALDTKGRIIMLLNEKPCSTTDLYRGLSSHIKKGKLHAALHELIACNRVRVKTIQTAGPPEDVFYLV